MGNDLLARRLPSAGPPPHGGLHTAAFWRHVGEMTVAMVVGMCVLALIVLTAFWAGALPAGVVLPLEMLLMLPVMVAVMALQAEEDAGPHR